ncbi:MAG TPA: TadE/TadG family type IV pilus assembly protein [Bryobacteraceae bacterium]|jgi:Flp pilus assembly protein TadG|nr:TadE/TadG family type IV pilus assembly protein [Bryobacteraceae bacterium]
MSAVSGRERGSAMLEFLFVGIMLMMLLLIILEMCIALWSYNTLAVAVQDGALYASTKGQGCTYTGNSCRVTVSSITQDILAAGVGINPSQLNLTFHSSASAYYADINCTASNCLSNATVWPPAKVTSGATVIYGDMPSISYIEITATYPSPVPIIGLFVPTQMLPSVGTLQFSAIACEVIQF